MSGLMKIIGGRDCPCHRYTEGRKCKYICSVCGKEKESEFLFPIQKDEKMVCFDCMVEKARTKRSEYL